MSIPQERLESVPSYLRTRYYSGEKSAYLKLVGKLSSFVSNLFEGQNKTYPPFLVLGSGSGAESLSSAQYLLGSHDRPNKIVNVDIHQLALTRVGEKSREFGLRRAGENLVVADVHDLPFIGETPEKGFGLVFMSSVLHEIQSFEGWKSAASVFREAERVLIHGGFLVVREFLPPKMEPCAVELKTPWARHFFEKLTEHFRRNFPEERKKEWGWRKISGKLIATNSRFAWEVFAHATMFQRECERDGDEQAFAKFATWRELKERYSLATKASKPLSIAHDLVASSGHPPGRWAYFSKVVPDSVHDQFLNENFAYFERSESRAKKFESIPIRLKRMWLVLHKHPEVFRARLSEKRMAEAINFYIDDSLEEVKREERYQKHNGFLNW